MIEISPALEWFRQQQAIAEKGQKLTGYGQLNVDYVSRGMQSTTGSAMNLCHAPIGSATFTAESLGI